MVFKASTSPPGRCLSNGNRSCARTFGNNGLRDGLVFKAEEVIERCYLVTLKVYAVEHGMRKLSQIPDFLFKNVDDFPQVFSQNIPFGDIRCGIHQAILFRQFDVDATKGISASNQEIR